MTLRRMMMIGRKRVSLVLAVLMIAVLSIGACAPAAAPAAEKAQPKAEAKPAAESKPTAEAKPAAEPKPVAQPKPATKLPSQVTMATMAVGGTLYLVTVGMGDMIKKYTGIGVTVEPTSGVGVWGPLMKQGEVEFATMSVYDPYTAARGIEAFAGKGKHPISLIGNGNVSYFGIFTSEKAGIKTVTDLKGKRLQGEFPAAPWIGYYTEALLEANGMSKNDVTWLKVSSPTESGKDLIEGRIDAFSYGWGPHVQEIDRAVGFVSIPVTEKEAAAAAKRVPGLTRGIWPKGAQGIRQDTPSLAMPMAAFARTDLADDTVYAVTKAIYDHTAELAKIHPLGAEWTTESALKAPAIAFHPGAIKYYKEKGLWTAELEATQQRLLQASK